MNMMAHENGSGAVLEETRKYQANVAKLPITLAVASIGIVAKGDL